MTHPLDRPLWSALTGPHAPLSAGTARARRYRPGLTAFAATADDGADALADLAGLVAGDETIVLLQADPIRLPDGLVAVQAAMGVQMIADGPFEPAPDDRVTRLGADDLPDMLALAELTRPGPFSAGALALGDFWGMREEGRLVAMAGERMKLDGYTEVSGVCTHPDMRGRGLARLLSAHVAAAVTARGARPILHAFATNTAAIALYGALGFRHRADVHFAIVGRREAA